MNSHEYIVGDVEVVNSPKLEAQSAHLLVVHRTVQAKINRNARSVLQKSIVALGACGKQSNINNLPAQWSIRACVWVEQGLD